MAATKKPKLKTKPKAAAPKKLSGRSITGAAVAEGRRKSGLMEMVAAGLHRADGNLAIAGATLQRLRDDLEALRGPQLGVALRDVVLFAQFLKDRHRSEGAALALFGVAEEVATAHNEREAGSSGRWRK